MYTLEPGRRFLRMVSSTGNIILFSLTLNQNTGPYLFYNNTNYQAEIALKIGKWQNLAFTSKGTTLSMYIDGIRVQNSIITPFSLNSYTSVYFGLHDLSQLPNAEFDDIKIFNKSLTQTEIIQSSFNNF